MKRMASSFLTMALILVGISQAKADLSLTNLTGTIYENYNPSGNNDSNGGLISDQSTADNSQRYATFSLSNRSGLDFESPPSTYQIGAFLGLGSPAFSGHGGFNSTHSLNNTYIIITGSATFTNGNYAFTFSHDDGAELKLTKGGSTAIDYKEGGPTIADQSNPRDPVSLSGTYSFTVSYYENGAAPADLIVSAAQVTAAPEPATLTMAGIGLVALGGYKLRRRMKAAA